MLGVDERVHVLVAHLAEQLAQQALVALVGPAALDHPVAVPTGEGSGLLVAADGDQARTMPVREELVVPGELNQRVVPVEEDGPDHECG